MKKSLIATALALASMSSFASSYYVVVPMKGKATQLEGISVSLSQYSLAEALVGQAYSHNFNQNLQVTGDPRFTGAGVRWSVASGTLPAGLSLNASTGMLTGTPTAAGTQTFTVKATYQTKTGQQAYQVVAISVAVALNQATMPVATVNSAYSAFDFKPLLKVDGDAAFDVTKAAFSATGLPEGMSLSSAGVLSGIPKTKNIDGASFTVAASYKNASGQQVYKLIINGQALEVTQLALGSDHSCAVTTAGAAVCWGNNDSFQLGNGTSTNSSTPVQVAGLGSGVRSVAVGAWHSCALTTAGGVKCWGWGGDGALGTGDRADSAVPVDVVGLTSGVTSLSAMWEANCAVASGVAKCWGYGGEGQMGNNTYDTQYAPISVVAGIRAVAVGHAHACALTNTGIVRCWGQNSVGALGDGTYTSRATPMAVSGVSGATSITAGGYHTCVTMSGGRACWGANQFGQLGDGSTNSVATPMIITDGTVSISAGDGHTCLITGGGTARCFGNNYSGQTGNGQSGVWGGATTDLSSLGIVKSITAGENHTCAVMADNTAKCWGRNSKGQVGDGTTTNRPSPTAVAN